MLSLAARTNLMRVVKAGRFSVVSQFEILANLRNVLIKFCGPETAHLGGADSSLLKLNHRQIVDRSFTLALHAQYPAPDVIMPASQVQPRNFSLKASSRQCGVIPLPFQSFAIPAQDY